METTDCTGFPGKTGIQQLMDKFATYLSIKANKGERVDFFKILTTGKE